MHEDEKKFVINDNHPSLNGHFIDHPVVPGVVILEHVLKVFHASSKAVTVNVLSKIKFISPLTLNQQAHIRFSLLSVNRFNFTVLQDKQVIAQGCISQVGER